LQQGTGLRVPELAVAAENWIESSGVRSWQTMEESKEFSWELKVLQWRKAFICAVVQWHLKCVVCSETLIVPVFKPLPGKD
jgi:hypothetical protein